MTRAFVTLQYLLPHHALSRLVYRCTRCRILWLKNLLIRAFVRGYRPAMADALESDPLRYASFNEFFTRRLQAEARPLDADVTRVLSPVDGRVSSAGVMRGNLLLQAKTHDFTLQQLLAGDSGWADALRGGSYATLYLAPYNYHRIHMPLTGTLTAAWHVPGRLFSVSDASAARIPGLFARNERVVCAFEAAGGPFVVVLVGALFVGSISTLWHGQITPRPGRDPSRLAPTTGAPLRQLRGAEFGCFNMGSTVILLLPPGAAQWDAGLRAGERLRVGQGIGTLGAERT